MLEPAGLTRHAGHLVYAQHLALACTLDRCFQHCVRCRWDLAQMVLMLTSLTYSNMHSKQAHVQKYVCVIGQTNKIQQHVWICLHVPASVPAVFDRPMTTPAYFGAMSMWLTEKPPLARPAMPKAQVVANTPDTTPTAAGMHSTASAAAEKPAARSNTACTRH